MYNRGVHRESSPKKAGRSREASGIILNIAAMAVNVSYAYVSDDTEMPVMFVRR